MSAILDMAIDAARADDIAAMSRAMGEAPVMRAFVVSIKRGQAIRSTFEAMGTDSCTVTAQHAGLLQDGEKLEVTPRRRGFDEQDLQQADLAYLAGQRRRDAERVRIAAEQEAVIFRARGYM